MRRGSVTRALALLLTAAALLAGCGGGTDADPGAPRPAGSGDPLHVMPLGDSLTAGFGDPDNAGYRLPLWERLVRENLGVDFVGSQHSGPPALGDKDHEGHIGYKIHELELIIDGTLSRYPSDVVLLIVGGNDIGNDYRVEEAPSRLRDLVVRICSNRPGGTLIVGSITPLPGLEPQVEAYNAEIPGIVQDVAATGCDARFVDTGAVIEKSDLFDNVHPDPSGNARLAEVWFGELRAVYASRRG